MLFLFILIELYEVCDLLGAEPNNFQTAITSRSLLDDGSDPPLVTELSANEATHSRDTLCKALYARLFAWIVNRINESIKVCLLLLFLCFYLIIIEKFFLSMSYVHQK